MSKRSKYTKEQKYAILKEIELSQMSVEDNCKKFNISNSTYLNWMFLYETYGIESLEESKTWRRYSKELKERAVLEYLNGEDSQVNICRKYAISSHSTLQRWIKRYNSHNELNTTKGRVDAVMTKGRKTSLEERIEIAKYCINQNKNYQETSEIYEVSYQQVYQWVKKFEDLGEDRLIDRRGKPKLELSLEDKEKFEMGKLKKENERLRMENDFLKKLQELERREY